MKRMRQTRRADEQRARELRKLAERIAKRERARDILYDLTGEWEPVKTHEWDEF